ncbi:hypothetical protein AVEN_122231-1 [Araneus ventricosus]|uniref:Uncharacterized protein n=1 Tax=Araneus ventricosus TaxID=182803 RepID=A0A4Y2KH98_ARAVE|nr:hypothetical protein AVEN_122231-1 [Araneus ventricosus]
MMQSWQSDWEDEDTGRSTLTSCQESRLNHAIGEGKKSRFLQDTAHFPRTRKGLNLPRQQLPMWKHKWHFFALCAECILTASFHMTKPAQQHELIWFRNVASNKGYRLKIQPFFHHRNDFQELFRIIP